MRLERDETSASNRRFVVRLDDGAEVESVLYRDDTLCVSSQVGCAVRCPFCASGANGLGRQLSADELYGQLELVRALGAHIARVTVSGVGEPLHNVDAVEAFVERVRSEGVWPSLTTSGGTAERLARALRWHHNGLTISVHAGTEATRARLVPKAPDLATLFGTLASVLPTLTNKKKKKTALAYLLLDGENDKSDELDAFAERARETGLAVHLYAHNAVPTSTMRSTPRDRYEWAFQRLRSAGLVVRMSSQARLEANGGCGTLVALSKKSHVRTPTAPHSSRVDSNTRPAEISGLKL